VTNLTDAEPKGGFFDVGCGFIVTAQEADRGVGVGRFGGVAELGEHGEDVGGVGEVGGVGGRADDDEVVAEGVVAGRGGDALVDGDLFGRLVVGDGHVDGARLEVVDADGGVALVPDDAEGGGAVGDARVDEGVGEGWVGFGLVE
jgi:hypothetical protein